MPTAPTLLSEAHVLGDFDSGVPSLDDWLKRRAWNNQTNGASRTYVVAEGGRVIAYYCLASGGLALADAPSKVRRNMPDPVPVAILGRLAVDRAWQRHGLGAALLQDAVLRTGQAARILGIRGIVVHALSDAARLFYERHGFAASPTNPMTLVLSLKGLATSTEE